MNDLRDLDAALGQQEWPRSFRELGAAFMAAALVLEDTDEISASDAVRALIQRLVFRELAVSFDAATLAIIALVGLQAGRTGTTPRTVLEERWKQALSDADWLTLLERARDTT